MKILIISGFLGAGKTTFIKELSKRTGKEIAILENEYGSSGIDGDILKASTEKVNIWELTEGCICCSVKGDFSASVLTIANTVNPDYLVIEPTGVAMLSNLIVNLKQIEYEHIRLMAPIAVVDALSIDRYKNEFPEIFKNQIKYAKTVVLSKSENLNISEKERIGNEISEINNECSFIPEHYTTLQKTWWDSLMSEYLDGTKVILSKTEDDITLDTFSIEGVSIRSMNDFIIFMENLIRGFYGNVIRAKGNFSIRNIKVRFDLADSRYMISVSEDEEVSDKAVFIGQEIKKQKIREVFLAASKYIKIGAAFKKG